MKYFQCHCGNRVYFENTACQTCGRHLGFDPQLLDIVSMELSASPTLATPAGREYRRCSNFVRYFNCNWLLPAGEAAAGEPDELCFSCRMNDIIPALDRPDNLKLWTRMEEAKRRLLYSLLSFRLPLTGEHALHFRFMEDHRRNPDVYESFVTTGRLNSTITINIAEADDAARHAAREQMHELYRTVLGHLRHESGHFYFGKLTQVPEHLAEARALFGDERQDYQGALQTYYANGPPRGWEEGFISAYATSHPAEDFAETFAHFLHITDALESARAGKLLPSPAAGDASSDAESDWIDVWIELAVSLNEISRSLGADDPYPFLLLEPVKRKLEFISRLVRQGVCQQPLAPPPAD